MLRRPPQSSRTDTLLPYSPRFRSSGSGAKIALAGLSVAGVDEFARLVQAGDVTALIRIPGIGKKTAERIVLELRERMAADYGGGPGVPGSGAAGIATDPLSEATVALQQLGYKPAEAQRMARQAFAEGDVRSEEHTSELQSLMRISYAVFCLKKNKRKQSNQRE